MATELLIDYAWQHPNPSAIKAGGYVGVLRYFSHDPSKDLTATEVAGLHKVGLGVAAVWETTSTEATAGFSAGAADATEAEARTAGMKYPLSVPIFYAVDEDVDPAKVLPYFKGIASKHKHPVGVYGSKRVVEAVMTAGLAAYGWQTEAWSGTAISAKAHLYQRVKATHSIAGAAGGWDEDAMLHPVPLWRATAPVVVKPVPAPAPAPKPAPKPAPAPAPKPVPVPVPEWWRRTLSFPAPKVKPGPRSCGFLGCYQKGPDVKHVQTKVGVKRPDGKYGRVTRKKVAAWQKAHGLHATGVVDKATAVKMGAK